VDQTRCKKFDEKLLAIILNFPSKIGILFPRVVRINMSEYAELFDT
jgi:hypothetical protein